MMWHVLLPMWTLLVVSSPIRIIDLSHNLGPDTLPFGNTPPFKRSNIFSGELPTGLFIRYGQFASGEFVGTYIDAPSLALRDGKTIESISVEDTIAEGVQIDCSKEAARDPSFLVPLQKVLDWEKEYGQIPDEAAVIFNFNWSSRYTNRKLFFGSESEDPFTFVSPAISPEVGEWLFNKRNIKILGTDVFSVDPFNYKSTKATSLPIHVKLLSHNRVIVEVLKGTERLPPRGFTFHATPVKYVGNNGAHVRAYAVISDRYNTKPGRATPQDGGY